MILDVTNTFTHGQEYTNAFASTPVCSSNHAYDHVDLDGI